MDPWEEWLAKPQWERWMVMSLDSLKAAGNMLQVDSRASASRYYYAAFQAMTGLLKYTDPNLNAPELREAWSHADTPILLTHHLTVRIPDRDRRKKMCRDLQRLYKVRVSADYISVDDVAKHLIQVRKDASYLIKIAQDITGVGLGGSTRKG